MIPASFLVAAIGMRLLVARAPAQLMVDLVQPLAVVTNWNAFGAAVLGVFTAAIAPAAAAYARIVKRGTLAAGLNSPLAVAGIVAFALACAWTAPVLFSSDVYAYAAYGELARLGADPYAHALLPSRNAIFDAAVVQWGNPPPACVYGPAFVWIAAAIVGVAAPFGTAVALDGLRALACVALIACALAAWSAYPGARAARLVAAATIALNPIVIWSAVEGHNDALALAIALAGFALARRGRTAAGAFVAALSGVVKLPGIVAGFPLALLDRRARIGAAAGAVAALATSIPLFQAVATRVAPHAHYAPQASFQAAVESLALPVFGSGGAMAAAWICAAAAAIACASFGIVRLRLREPEGWTYLASAGWLLVPNPYPWYAVWLAAIAAAAPGTRGAFVLLGLTFTSLLRYVPDAVAAPAPLVSLALGAVAVLPLALLLLPRKPSVIINRP